MEPLDAGDLRGVLDVASGLCAAEDVDALCVVLRGRRVVAVVSVSDRTCTVLVQELPGHAATAAAAGTQLTARELEVLGLVSGGGTNAEVATALCVSPHTVKKHLEHIYAKLGVRGRTAAARALTMPPGRLEGLLPQQRLASRAGTGLPPGGRRV